jgi:hypothetical protein
MEGKPGLCCRGLLEESVRMWRDNQRMERELEALLSEKPAVLNVRSRLHNRRPYRDPFAQPVKWMKLIQWWLLHRVSMDRSADSDRLVDHRRYTDTTRKKSAEAAEAGKAGCHANVRRNFNDGTGPHRQRNGSCPPA